MKFETPEPDEFDKETAEGWLSIDKKKRKARAKKSHPGKALADDAAAASKKRDKGTKTEPLPTK